MAEGYEKFLEFEWTDERWQAYLGNLYPTPNHKQLLKFKKKWYKKNIDTDFDETYEPPQPTFTPSDAGSAPPPFATGAHQDTGRWQVMGPKSTLCLLAHGVALTMSVGGVAGVFPAYQALVVLVAAFILEIIAKYGLKFNTEYLQNVLMDDVGVMPILAITLLMPGLHPGIRLLALISPTLTSLLSFSQICKAHDKVPRAIQDFFAPLAETSARYQVMTFRSHAEVAIGLLLIFAVLTMRAAPVSALFFWNFMMLRYMMSPWTQASFRIIDGFLETVLGRIPLIRNAYAAMKRGLYSFVDPESRRAGRMCSIL